MKLSDLKPAPKNPRVISGGASAGLQKSMTMFGDIAGITWNKTTGHIVSGHQRVDSLKKLYGEDGVQISEPNADNIATITCPTGDVFTVRIVEWDEAKEKTANVSANNPAIGGEFTFELQTILDEIKTFEPEVFDDLLLDFLFDEKKQVEPKNVEIPEQFGGKTCPNCGFFISEEK